MPTRITSLTVRDIRFPTSRNLDGSDAMNPDPDYSCAYVTLCTDHPDGLEGNGITFTIGRGNELCVAGVEALKSLVVGHTLESFTENMGAFWRHMTGDSQLRWVGPDKGVIHLATAAVVNAVWDLYARVEQKPLWKLLVDSADEGLGTQVWGRLPDDVQTAAKDAAKNAPGEDMQKALVDSLNEIVRTGDLHKALGKTTEETCVAVDSPQVAVDCEHFPTDTSKWSELETRTFHRSLIEFLYPQGIPARAASSGSRKTLRYMGRGEGFGELGVVTEALRSATIFAYDHPDGGANQRLPDSRTGAIPSRVELVKMSREDFLLLTERSAALKNKVNGIVADYQRQAKIFRDTINDRVEVRSQSPDFEQLGLIQGQKLMLIDLDRCTRCGQCVDACVSAHDDGRTRLYLDGPRFEKYLVPLSCRSCMDPVCMIGCPVGSINRGDNGEIEIRDWCIGCSLCADQCPYGSIQMNALEGGLELTASQQALLGGEDIKNVNERAVVCDLCSSLPSKSPSCVYACPHDAAMRVNSLEFFFDHTH